MRIDQPHLQEGLQLLSWEASLTEAGLLNEMEFSAAKINVSALNRSPVSYHVNLILCYQVKDAQTAAH